MKKTEEIRTAYNAYQLAWYYKNREKVLKEQKEYRIRNREKRKISRLKNIEKIRESMTNFGRSARGVLTDSYFHQLERCKKYKRDLDYTKEELIQRFIHDPTFISIYEYWTKNGYQYYDKPSIDRINPLKGYNMLNIQIMTWRENRLKGNIEVGIANSKRMLRKSKN